MSEPAISPLKSTEWFPNPRKSPSHGGVGSALAKLAVGAGVGLLFYLAHRHTLAYVVWAISGAVGGVSVASASARAAIDGALAKLGRAVGTAIGTVLLTAVYLMVVTPLHFLRRAMGADDLHLRDARRQSYWLACDDDERKARWVGTMFATEVAPRTGHPLRTAVLSVAALVLLAEGVSRFYGFGHTVLYYADPDIGYYPQPSAELVRYGGRVATNKFSMRSAEVERQKPPGVFRILMLGDSTLYAGSYVDQADMYATQVEKRLNALGLPGKVEVLAMGCNGWGPFHERGYIHKYPDAFQADLTLVNLPIDDVNRPLYGLMEVPFFPVDSPPRFGLEEIFNHLVWRYRDERTGKDDAWHARQSVYGIREYGALTDDLNKAGTEVMFFVLPTVEPGFGGPEWKTDGTWRERLERTVGKRGARTYFARGHFSGRGTKDEIYHDFVHLNPKGHHVYAEFIEAKIKEDSQRFRAFQSGHAAPPAPSAPKPENQPAMEAP